MEWFLPLTGFVFVTTITPGPNNLLLAASGIRFGVRRTLPHVLGIHIGVYSLVLLSGLGLGQMMLALPGVELGLKVFASLYLLYLAWQILGLRVGDEEQSARPMRIWEASLFQLSNPKAWMMAVTGINFSLAIDQTMPVAVLALCFGFGSLGLVCNLAWVALGSSLQSALHQPRTARLVNYCLAAITVATVAVFWIA